MPSLTPQASSRRFVLRLSVMLAMLAMSVLARSPLHTGAQTTSEGDVRLSPAMSTVPAGAGGFTVFVVLEDLQHAGNVTYDDDRDGTPDRSIPSEGLGAFQFTIEYDPAVVEFQDVARGPNLSRTGRSFQCLPAARDTGTVTFGCLSPGSSPAGAQGTLTLASVQFAPRSNGLSPLVLSAEIAGPLGDSATVDVGGGAVRVNGTSATSTPKLPSGVTNTPAPPAGSTPTSVLSQTARPTGERATASAVASGTPSPGLTADLTATETPGPGIDDPKHSGSGHAWLWLVGIAAAITLGALGLTAILWRRRDYGS